MKTKIPDMPWLKCLTQVRKLIKSGNCTYICHAIFSVLREANCEEILTTKYQQRIQDQLGDCDTYGSWLAQNHYSVFRKSSSSLRGSQKFLVPGRLAWIDNMIKLEKERLSK